MDTYSYLRRQFLNETPEELVHTSYVLATVRKFFSRANITQRPRYMLPTAKEQLGWSSTSADHKREQRVSPR